MQNKTNVLLIEDDRSICSYVTTALSGNGYRVTCAITAAEGLSLCTSLCPDILLLDLGLPDMDGLEVISSIRSWSSLPIIILSARSKEQDKVEALDLGADDYLTKPFGPAELMARIRTSLRRRYLFVQGNRYKASELEIDFDKRLVTLAGQEIHLTQIEYQLLTLLAENSGKVLTYTHLIKTIWGPYMDTNNQILRVNMANIRRKLEKNPANPQYIFTEIGIGYRMRETERS